MPSDITDLPTSGMGITLLVVDALLRIAALGIIPGNRRPAVGMAWLLLILFVPTAGFIAFLFLGSNRVGRSRTNRQEKVTQLVRDSITTLPAGLAPDSPSAIERSIYTLGSTLGGYPATEGQSVDLHTDYNVTISRMVELVNAATKYVHVEFYIMAWDDTTSPFFDALTDAARRGVDVRVLFDHVGCFGIPGYRHLGKKLTKAGLEWHRMLPIRPLRGQFRRPDLRNHRKILIVDGEVAMTGSQNLIDSAYGKQKNNRQNRRWLDAMAEIRGPAVTAMDVVFATDWFAETGHYPWTTGSVPELQEAHGNVTAQVIPSGPGYAQKNNLRIFTSLIHASTDSLRIVSPYFVPDESLLQAVTSAALRGVDVQLFVGEEGDQFMVQHAQQSYYRELLTCGVRIFLYPPPKVLHSKFFTVDGQAAVFGSSNMDMRSFALNYEITMLFANRQIASELEEVAAKYRNISKELTLDTWLARPPLKRYVDNVMRLTAELQ